LPVAAQGIWVLVRRWSRTMATASWRVSPRAGRERLIEPVRTQRLAALDH
jgi:hypothetical protein